MASCWGKLVSLFPEHAGDLELCQPVFLLGRSKSCDASFRSNRVLSSKHCTVTFDASSGEATVADTSSNGVFVNGALVGKGSSVVLKEGDTLVLVKPDSEDDTRGVISPSGSQVTPLGWRFVLNSTAREDVAHVEQQPEENERPLVPPRAVDAPTLAPGSTAITANNPAPNPSGAAIENGAPVSLAEPVGGAEGVEGDLHPVQGRERYDAVKKHIMPRALRKAAKYIVSLSRTAGSDDISAICAAVQRVTDCGEQIAVCLTCRSSSV